MFLGFGINCFHDLIHVHALFDADQDQAVTQDQFPVVGLIFLNKRFTISTVFYSPS